MHLIDILTFALQVGPSGLQDGQEDGEQLHQVSGDVAGGGLVVHHVQRVEGLQRDDREPGPIVNRNNGWVYSSLLKVPANKFRFQDTSVKWLSSQNV